MAGNGKREDQRRALEEERAAQLEDASPEDKERAVRELIRKTSATSALTAVQPIPLVDVAILTPLQHHMVRCIARIHGVRLDHAALRRMFRAVRGPIIAGQTLIALSKFLEWIPFLSEVLSSSLAYALTHAIGVVTDQYFLRPGTPVEELRSCVLAISKEQFEEAFRVKRDEMKATYRDPETRRQIKELENERRHDKIDVDEEVRRMDLILSRAS